MSKQINQLIEKAQILPVVVIGLMVVIMLAAVLIDGGVLFSNRRSAQAAADAGAIAGAHEMCYPTGAGVEWIAKNYAMQQNGATSAIVKIVNINGVNNVQVDATVTLNDSFFSRIFNNDTLTASATASAGCFAPMGNYLMPIAWSCRAPVGEGAYDPELGCKMLPLDWDEVGPLITGETSSMTISGNGSKVFEMDGDNIVDDTKGEPPSQIYIIMDTFAVNTETVCKENLDPSDPAYANAVKCDLDGDGKMDIEGAGNRGWLDITGGGGGASELIKWIKNGLNFVLSPHMWLEGQPGATTPVYEAIKDYRQGQVVLIPIFNAICDDKNPTTNFACMTAAHADPWPPEPAGGDIEKGDQKPQFHIVAFDAFYISCVHTKKGDKCPGFEMAQDKNPDPKHPNKSIIGDNVMSVEGFFLTNYPVEPNVDVACDINLGNCTVSLSK